MYNCFEFEVDEDINIYMSPELFQYYFKAKNRSVDDKKSNTFSIALLLSSFICSLNDKQIRFINESKSEMYKLLRLVYLVEKN